MDAADRNVFLTPVEYLKGIGPRRAEALKSEMGVFNAGDLLNFFPYRYIDKTRYYPGALGQDGVADMAAAVRVR